VQSSDRVVSALDAKGVRLEPATVTIETLYGSVPLLTGRETVGFEDQIEEAMAGTARLAFEAVERGEEEATTIQ